MKYVLFILSLSLPFATADAATHAYSQGELKFSGQFFPAKKKKAPGIVLIHNWMGVTGETEKQAKRFQALGYNVLAADIYGADQRPSDVKTASEMATKYKTDRKLFRERIHLAIEELKKQPGVDASKTAVLGYCFGGTGALEAGRAGEDVRAIISFHGGLDSLTPADGAKIKGKVLALHGAIDPYVPAKDLEAFEKEMQNNKVNYEIVKYGSAVHSFTEVGAGNDASKGAAYNVSADERSFSRAKEFLTEAFK